MKFEMDYIGGVIRNELKNQLLQAMIKGELLEIGGGMRGLGTTTALIDFALIHGFGVIVSSSDVAQWTVEAHLERNPTAGKLMIVSQKDLRGRTGKFVVDKDVDMKVVKDSNVEVVTGYRV